MPHFPFKKLFFAIALFMIPFTVLESILALFDIAPVNFNNVPRTGWVGFIIPILFFPFMAVILSGSNWVVLNGGYWFYSLFFKPEKD